MNAQTTYPALMAYILDRNTLGSAAAWCEKLREDKQRAEAGEFCDVAAELQQAQADYAAKEQQAGRSGYPYNRAMGEFLGLSIKPGNNEPEHGYYMASGVMTHYRLGVALRAVRHAIAEGRELRIPIAKSKRTGAPVRFAKFAGVDQIKIEGNAVTCNDGKRRVRLSSNWSEETCLQRVAEAMSTGRYYGENAPAVR